MKRFLSDQERLELKQEHQKERDRNRADRLKAILLADSGWMQAQIAEALFIVPGTVKNYLDAYKNEKRTSPNHKGSDPILKEEESEALSSHLESNVYTKVKDIKAYVKMTFSKDISISGVYLWLKTHDFSYKKPKLIPKDVNIEKQRKFIEDYERLMNKTARTGDPVLFIDAVHPTQQVQATFGWFKKGKDKKIETTAGRKRINLLGALNLEDMKATLAEYETIDGNAVISFFQTVEERYKDDKEIHIILDQAGYNKSKEVEKYLKTSRIRVHFLPPRSPNLNPIERLWKIMHEHVSNNKTHVNFKAFRDALWDFFNFTMPSIHHELISRITDNFQILTPP